jgi:hypothetical protein
MRMWSGEGCAIDRAVLLHTFSRLAFVFEEMAVSTSRDRRYVVRKAAAPLPILRTPAALIRDAWLSLMPRRRVLSAGYVAILVSTFLLGLLRSIWYDAALVAWLIGGGLALAMGSIVEADRLARMRAHEACPTPLIGGYRLARQPGEISSDVLLALDLVAYLYAHSRTVTRPVRGRRAASRTTYEVGLRNLCRQWAAEREMPVRTGDRVGRELVRTGVIRVVAISQARAWRLTSPTVESAIKTLELATGVSLIRWDIGASPVAVKDGPASASRSP